MSIMADMNMRKTIYFLVLFFTLIAAQGYCLSGPTLLMDSKADTSEFVGGIGPLVKYKRVSAPSDFGGDMTVWGVRAFGGKLNDPEIGFIYSSGSLSGTSLKFKLDMAGLTLEDSFREDSRVKWRASFGVGQYSLQSRASGLVMNKGSFAFLEPMLVGVLPMSRHIVLEFAVGYTFAGATGVRVEGLAINAELLMGKF